MARFLVRNIEDSVSDRPRRRAERNGHSLEAELRDILRAAAAREDQPQPACLGTRIAGRFAGLDMPEIVEVRAPVGAADLSG